MAEQLYVQMLAVQSDAEGAGDSSVQQAAGCAASYVGTLQQLPPEDLEAALDVLLVSAWDGPLEQVRESREQLAAALHVEIKTRRLARVRADAGVPGTGSGIGQESYQSLLDDAARGGGY
jgi:hypothetical protein